MLGMLQFCDLEGINVQELEVIDLPGYCHLFIVDNCIGNTEIVWVDDKGCLVI
jgi:hypothetical protein